MWIVRSLSNGPHLELESTLKKCKREFASYITRSKEKWINILTSFGSFTEVTWLSIISTISVVTFEAKPFRLLILASVSSSSLFTLDPEFPLVYKRTSQKQRRK